MVTLDIISNNYDCPCVTLNLGGSVGRKPALCLMLFCTLRGLPLRRGASKQEARTFTERDSEKCGAICSNSSGCCCLVLGLHVARAQLESEIELFLCMDIMHIELVESSQPMGTFGDVTLYVASRPRIRLLASLGHVHL
eukprot:1518069-Amphidinium_carterae.1